MKDLNLENLNDDELVQQFAHGASEMGSAVLIPKSPGLRNQMIF
jgi:hypothetical protein